MNLIGFLVINLIATILCFVRTQHKANYFFSGYLSAMSLGILASILDPIPIKHAVDQIIPNQLIARFLASISYPFSPYFLLLASISLANIVPKHKKKRLARFLAIPIIIQYLYGLIIPKESFVYVYLDYSRIFIFAGIWGSIYVLLANALICHTLFTEKNAKIRFQKFLITVLTLPTLFVTYQAYIVPIKGSHEFTSYTVYLGIFTFIAAAFFAIRYGFMGIRLVIGKDYLDNSLKTMTMGTSLLNHSIKNEIQTIDAAIALLRNRTELKNERALQLISESTLHLKKIIKRIDFHTQDIILEKEKCDLVELINEALEVVSPALNAKEIRVEKKNEMYSFAFCDPVHIKEVIINILNNAIEAMDTGGKLSIELLTRKHHTKIIIADSGMGIAKENLPYILNPFFTTKTIRGNYGLGLSYCYKVLQEHGGSLDISSVEKVGTVVTLTLPIKKKSPFYFLERMISTATHRKKSNGSQEI